MRTKIGLSCLALVLCLPARFALGQVTGPAAMSRKAVTIAIVDAGDAERAVEFMRSHALSKGSQIIGAMRESDAGIVTMKSAIGINRIVDMLSGEQLPRIC